MHGSGRWIAVAAIAGAIAALALMILGFYSWSTNPAIARIRGQVTAVNAANESTEICLSGVSDAGSTYGNKSPRERECWDGIAVGTEPRIGQCVVLEIQGEGAELKVARASGC